MIALAIVAFVLCVGDIVALAHACRVAPFWPRVRREAVRVVRPVALPRPEPMPELYAGRHRSTVLIGGSR